MCFYIFFGGRKYVVVRPKSHRNCVGQAVVATPMNPHRVRKRNDLKEQKHCVIIVSKNTLQLHKTEE